MAVASSGPRAARPRQGRADTSGPFGVVNFLHYSGYWAGDDRIRGFSHLHLHGAGASDYGVLSVMPAIAFDPARRASSTTRRGFAKADEHAAAGRYEVTAGERDRASC